MTIVEEILKERERQTKMWGTEESILSSSGFDKYLLFKLSVLGEEAGECFKARNDWDLKNLREELIQTAAVAVAIVEGIDLHNKEKIIEIFSSVN